jgi:putative tryptophan/tyrosine transport system substrate-binding protein
MLGLAAKPKGRASALFCFLLLAAISAHAQQRLVGVLLPNRAPPEYSAFTQELARLGWQDGRNLKLLKRDAGGNFAHLPALAEELVKARPEVLVSIFTPPTRAAMQASRTIPIVGFFGAPVELGFVDSIARPGSNVTGVTNLCGEMAGKRLTLLKEAVPKARRVAVLLNSNDPVTQPQIEELKRITPGLGIEVRFYTLKRPDDLQEAFDEAVKWRADAGLWLCGQGAPFQPRTAELALKHRLPVMVSQRQDVEGGGLISYWADHYERFRVMALYVDRILKGAKPANLPIDQPLQFELVVNLKTAQRIGMTIPQSVLTRADVVIQ